MSTINYIGGGYVLDIEENPNLHTGYFAILNSVKRDAEAKITFYYEDQEKTEIENIGIPAESSKVIRWEEYKEIVKGKRWGAKITSTERVVVQETQLAYGPEGWYYPYKMDYWSKEDHIPNTIGTTTASPALSRVWHHADGFNIVPRPRFDIHHVGSSMPRLYEPEFFAFLNPMENRTEVIMTAYYIDQTKTIRKFTVPAERYKWIPWFGEVITNKPFGTSFISTQPILVHIDRIVHDIASPVQRAAFCMTTSREPASTVNYFGGPHCKVWIFNPNRKDANVTITLYFEDQKPTQLKLVQPAESTASHVNYMSKAFGFGRELWGTKIESDEPIIVQGIHGTFGPEDTAVIGQLTTAMDSYMAATELSKCWYYADGIVHVPPTELSKKLYAPEFAYVLNSTKADAEVTMTVYYSDQRKGEARFKVSAERMKVVALEEVVEKNKRFGVCFESTEPLVIQFERQVYVNGNPLRRTHASDLAFPCHDVIK